MSTWPALLQPPSLSTLPVYPYLS